MDRLVTFSLCHASVASVSLFKTFMNGLLLKLFYIFSESLETKAMKY